MSTQALGLVARKVGMMRVFTDDGVSIPVTVLDVSRNAVAQVRQADKDGYSAVQVAFGATKPSSLSKAEAGHLAKAAIEPAKLLCEFRVPADVAAEYQPGAALSASLFSVGQYVDVRGLTIGKGYAGAIKRHHFSSNRASHGNSVTTRAPGSIGMAQDPGRVFPGKRMSGRLGGTNVTIQNLEVVRVDAERALIMVKGSIPGADSGCVTLRPAVKKAGVQS
ncbi:MAG: 50S ribosomal protein L3 [Proteobacteria bacterium]|nr:50S ribosomal protein L3 [Pseudomonadota bacterium]